MFSVASFLLENTWGNSLVPAAKFLEDIDKVVEEHGGISIVFQALEQLYTRYKILDSSLSRQKRSFQEKIPDLTNALQVVRWLQSSGDGEQKEPMETTFELADNVYSTAWVKNPQVVYLWLGANVMVEYSFEEAESLLKENLDGARDKIQQLEKDLAFLREQMTTTEVNISRVYTAQLKKQTSNVA
ncbi:prefoldin subunit 3 [Galdieria sulphuraria]|uniref:Prefoldin subunit 3 n=1 Tax=Galdieria sulphuraria TaxID=130081 RepID=M2XAR5_GALSU|nr:prefoldin subunit 3 [Galdieria sulphuraria]EME26977.1 prefoldin subunit 3 [Galdieria sulphuraria]|eukprot:XP_005703497.1 prefoldin subunit 3 [Galdieria sulphuraria]